MVYNKNTDNKIETLKENKSLVVVPVIASYNVDGKMIPIYFQVEGIRIKVDRVALIKSDGFGYEYSCEITQGQRVEVVTLCYFTNLNVWALDKRRNQ